MATGSATVECSMLSVQSLTYSSEQHMNSFGSPRMELMPYHMHTQLLQQLLVAPLHYHC